MANAYAPYSGLQVGAAVLDVDGTVHRGANVENASFGLTLCAERVAAFSAVASGSRELVAIGIVSNAPEPLPPCGGCRQVLAEFGADSMIVVSAGHKALDISVSWSLGELIPEAFREIPR